MDTSTFQQLLAKALQVMLGERTISKGLGYLGQVSGMEVELGEDSGWLSALVQGSAPQPYAVEIEVQIENGEAFAAGNCSCPVGFNCKHVAATLLVALKEGLPPARTDTGNPGQAAGSGSPLGEWKGWLERLVAGPPALPAPASGREALISILLSVHPGSPQRLRAQPAWVQRGKRGGYVKARPLVRNFVRPDPWDGLDGQALRLVGALRMSRLATTSGAGESYELRGVDGETLLVELLAAMPCFFERPANGALTPGPTRNLRARWLARGNGCHELVPDIEGAARTSDLFAIEGLWYHDPEARQIGRVNGEPRLAQVIRSAPLLQPEQIPLLRERWKDSPLLAALPAPPAPLEIQRIEGAPVPVLTLRSVPLHDGRTSGQHIGVARLGFDYGGVRLAATAEAAVERRAQDGRVFEVVRDRKAEIAAWERLDEAGLELADAFYLARRVPPGSLDEDDLVLEQGRSQLAGVEQLFALAPRLRSEGFRLESAEGFPFDLLDAPAAGDWFAEVHEEGGNAWFDLELGITIAGERVDLLPVLQRLLADPLFPLAPRKGEAKNAIWLVALDERRRMPLPLARLRQLISPLLEWLQGASLERRGPLRLRRAQADVVERLAGEAGLPWRGAERLRSELDRLRAPRPPAAAPAGLQAALRDYQRDGLGWLGLLADLGLGGVLADDMGLGKTVQVLAHLLAEKERGRLGEPALAIVPTSLVGNWRDEAARFVPSLRVLVIHGPSRAGLHAGMAQHDLVVTTYPLLLRDRELLLRQPFSVLVLDEAQAIKNARSKAGGIVRELEARQRIAMTGTPLENHLGELWAQFDAVEPGLLGDERQFTRFFRTPIEKHGDVERRERLQRRIAPLLLRRRKEDVLAELPPKTEIARRIELEGEQRTLYETLRLAQHERVLAEVRKRGLAQSGIIVLDALLKLRQACCDPRLVKLEGARKVRESAKLEALLELLENLVAEGRRILVFSQFTEMLALIAAALEKHKLAFQTLTGDTPGTRRGELVARFQAGEVPVFLISLKAGGVGLNLTAADTVVHYDPWWNPAVEAQATDRTHRIGQDKPVFVYRLICAGTVEEKIQALQQRKAELAQAVLDGGSTQGARFEEADLAELFAPL